MRSPSPAILPAGKGDEAWGGVTGALMGSSLCLGKEQLLVVPLSSLGRPPTPSHLSARAGAGAGAAAPGRGAGGRPCSSGSSFSVPALLTRPRHRWGCASRGNSHGAQIPVRAARASRVCQVSGFGAIAKATGELSPHSVYPCFASPGDNAGQFRPRGLRREPSLSVEGHPRTGLLGGGDTPPRESQPSPAAQGHCGYQRAARI